MQTWHGMAQTRRCSFPPFIMGHSARASRRIIIYCTVMYLSALPICRLTRGGSRGKPRPKFRLAWFVLFLPLAIPLGDGASVGLGGEEKAMLKSDLVMLLSACPLFFPREFCLSLSRPRYGEPRTRFTIKNAGKKRPRSIHTHIVQFSARAAVPVRPRPAISSIMTLAGRAITLRDALPGGYWIGARR